MNTDTHILPARLRTTLLRATLLLAALGLSACGPKNVGEDTPKADEGYSSPAREPAEQLRYPISGNRIEQRLYYMNQPHVMIELQQRQRDYFDRRYGAPTKDAPTDYNNLKPRQPSPFRQ